MTPKNPITDWLQKSLQKSKIYAIIGSRGSGKTCLGFALLEWHKPTQRPTYVYKHPKPKILPKWIKNLTDINKAPPKSIILIDEAGIEFNQFSFASKPSIALANTLKTARHKDLSIIFITQNGANLTRDVRRLIDSYILRKPSLTQLYDEISIVKRMYQNCQALFATKTTQTKGFYITEIGELAYFDPPTWWTPEISKSYERKIEPINISQQEIIIQPKKQKD